MKAIRVQFKETGKRYYFSPGDLDIKNKDLVVVSTIRGIEIGMVNGDIIDIKEKDLEIIPQSQEKTQSEYSFSSTTLITEEKPVFELRLLGMRGEEALKALEKQLDLCTVNNFSSFSVIHGKGNGILQQLVHDYLSHYPGVKEFHFARPEEGGTGKTYVTMQT